MFHPKQTRSTAAGLCPPSFSISTRYLSFSRCRDIRDSESHEEARVYIVHAVPLGALRRPYDPRCNRLSRHHVDRIFERFKALPIPLTSEASLALYQQIQADHQTRVPVRLLQRSLIITCVAENPLRQYAKAIHAWLVEQEEKRRDNLGDAMEQRFDA